MWVSISSSASDSVRLEKDTIKEPKAVKYIVILAALLLVPLAALHAADKPNIVFILADDLGYGDVSCYNDRAKVPTPNLDRLAARGCGSPMPTARPPFARPRATA